MPYDQKLAERVRGILSSRQEVSEKRMFGGLAFMFRDKMCCGVIKDMLVARIGPEQAEIALKKSHVSPMDFTGRPLKGYVYVDSFGIQNYSKLRFWVELSISFVTSLSDGKSNKRRKTISQASGDENPKEIPLSKLVNFGPVTLREFKKMGLTTFGHLEDLGWEAVCRNWVEHFPERLNVNAFVGVIATLEGIPWTQASASDRAKARGLVDLLRREYGLPARAIGSKRHLSKNK